MKGAVPQTIADDRERRRARFVFVFAVGPAELRLEPDRVEEIRGRERNGDPFRFTPGNVAQVKRFEPGQGQMLKRFAVVPPIDIIRQGDGSIGSLDDFVEVNEPLRLRIGQRPEQHVVDDAEDGGVRADPEREREHGDEGEARRFAKLAESEAKIVHRFFPFVGRPPRGWMASAAADALQILFSSFIIIRRGERSWDRFLQHGEPAAKG